MTLTQNISAFISRLACSLALLATATAIQAQGKLFAFQKDSIPLFRGFAVSVDIAGPIAKSLSDYGEIEGAELCELLHKTCTDATGNVIK